MSRFSIEINLPEKILGILNIDRKEKIVMESKEGIDIKVENGRIIIDNCSGHTITGNSTTSKENGYHLSLNMEPGKNEQKIVLNQIGAVGEKNTTELQIFNEQGKPLSKLETMGKLSPQEEELLSSSKP